MSQTSRFNLLTVFLFLPFLLLGCAGETAVERGSVGTVRDFYGAISGDEPNSVLTARSVLVTGGSAVDAAVAMIFAMTVTMPARVSLAAGGTCIIHDAEAGITEALDFIAPPGTGPAGDRPTAVPALVRGMVALHARYGRFDWRRLILPAERMARQGHHISRATAGDLKVAAKILSADPGGRAIFIGDDGNPLKEGMRMRQLDLAGMLGRVRAKGGGVVYGGAQARLIVDSVRDAGGTLSMEDLRRYRPSWKPAIVVPVGEDLAYFSPPAAGSGVMGAQMLALLQQNNLYADAADSEKPYLLAEMIKAVDADRMRYMNKDGRLKANWEELLSDSHISKLMAAYRADQTRGPKAPDAASGFEENPTATGLVVVDRFGMAVACELSLNNIFGTGRIAPGTGTILAAAPTGRSHTPMAFGPVIVANSANFSFRYAAAASGGRKRIGALAVNMAAVLLEGRNLSEADKLTRVAVGPALDEIYLEQTASEESYRIFARRGQTIYKTRPFGRVNAVYCQSGLPVAKEGASCNAQQDSRGHGLSLFAR